jgi:hypothetical protein
MLAFRSYVDLDKKKPKVDDSDATEHYGNDRYKISTKTDSVLDDIVQEKPFSKSKEQQIDPYEEKGDDKFKSKAINFKDFDDLLIGFEDHPKPNPLGAKDNTALFGKVSPDELMISNLETQAGTSNKLNTLLRHKETGDSIDDIRASDAQLGKEFDAQYDNALNSFMKDYNALPETKDKDELKYRAEGKKRSLKALEQIRDEQKKSARIKGIKKFMPTKRTVIKPVVPVEKKPKKFISQRRKGQPPLRLDVLQNPVEGFNDTSKIGKLKEPPDFTPEEGKVSSLIQEFENLAITPPKPATRARKAKATPPAPRKPIEIPNLYPREIPNVIPKDPFTEKLTVKLMKEMAKDQHIKRYSTMNKSQLIQALNLDPTNFKSPKRYDDTAKSV